MRILVAIRAEIEGDADVSRLAIVTVDMALGALHLRVQTRQWVSGLAVIELPDVKLLPIHKVVAGLAGGTETALVEIFVARNAGSRKTEKGAVQIFIFDCRAFLRGYARCVVALVTGQSRVLAFQHVPGFLVVEGLGVPFNQREVFAIVFGVTASTLLARAGRNVIRRVQSLVSGNSAGDLSVALLALESGLTAKFVTGGTVACAVQRLVRP